MIRLYIVEDHFSIIVSGFKRHFYSSRDGISVAGASSSVEDAIKNADPDSFDIFILDLWLENMLPVKNIEALRKQFPEKKIIIFTSEDSSVWKQKMYKEGAMAFVSKKASRTELKTIIEKAARGEKTFNVKLEDSIQKVKDPNDDHPSDSLTPVQHELIILLASGLNQHEVASTMNISVSTLEKTLKSLRKKFQVKSNIELFSLLGKRSSV